jgi:hypothetical protein
MFGFQPIPIETDPSGIDPPPPDCIAVSASTYAGTGTSHNITMPVGIVTGDAIVIVAVYKEWLAAPSFPGFTLLNSQSLNNVLSEGVLRTYIKISDGSEGSSITATTSFSNEMAVVAHRLFCASSSSVGVSGGSGSSATTSAPSPSIPYEVAQMLCLGFVDGTKTATFPSGYDVILNSSSTGSTSSSYNLYVGWKTVSSSEAPGSISISGSVDWATIVEVFS